jgi:hypothetical protein
MLYKFKARNTGDVIMLEPNGRRVLEIIGKEPGPQGIILSAQMPSALLALEAAVVLEEQTFAEEKAAFQAGTSPMPPRGDGVSLRQRVQPMMDMLRRCYEYGDDIVWGV